MSEYDHLETGDTNDTDPYGSAVRADEAAELRRLREQEPWDEVFAGKPDLIASGRNDNSAVLFRMSRLHASILGAYLNGRNDIAPLPPMVVEVLEALTLRLVQPRGSRWADLRRALQGQPVITPDMVRDWQEQEAAQAKRTGRHRRPYDGGPDGEDLRADLRPAGVLEEMMHDRDSQALLGDADGTTVHEMFRKEEK